MQFELLSTSTQSITISMNNIASTAVFKEEALKIDALHIAYSSFEGLYLMRFSTGEDEITLVNENTISYVAIHGIISGTASAENSSGEVTYFNLRAGQYHVYYPSPVLNIIRLGKSSDCIVAFVPEEFLLRRLLTSGGVSAFFIEHLNQSKAFITSPFPLNFNTLQLFEIPVAELTNDNIKRIRTEAKVLEMIAAVINQLELQCGENVPASFLKSHDIEKIYQAKKYIERNLRSPCSLIELSRKVGLNDFKLKKGFKEVVGNTVFGYLADCRMKKANDLLLEKKSVSEVSYLVGYKNPHHFTAAYKKKYGVLPSTLNK